MQAGHRVDHRFAGLASDVLIFVAPCLRVRVHGGNLAGTALHAWGTVELASPKPFPRDELVRRVLGANDDTRRAVADIRMRYLGGQLDDRSLTPGDDGRTAPTRVEGWLNQSADSPKPDRKESSITTRRHLRPC